VRIPYSEEYDPPAPVVEVVVRSPRGKSVRLWALLDSGADITVFPRELLDELGLIPGSTVLVKGYDGSTEEHYSYFIEVEVEGVMRSLVEAVAGEDMLLGRNFLNGLNVTLRGKDLEAELIDP